MKLISYIGRNYSNYGSSKSKIFYPKNKKQIFNLIKYSQKKKYKILSIGSSLSWFDTIFNTNNIVINLKDFENVFKLDKKEGILTVSPFYKISDIIEKINRFGWTIYSSPGYPNVTVGGCVSNDVHGKDSFAHGNFGENIIELEVILSNRRVVRCSKIKNKEIFRSVVGGLGLIGIVTKVKLRLKRISSSYVTNVYKCQNYKELIRQIYFNKKKYEYLYGWIDFYSTGSQLGRGIIFKSKGDGEFKTKTIKNEKIFNKINGFLTNKVFIFFTKFNLNKYLNFLFFHSFKFKKKEFKSSYKEVAWPLDSNGIDVKKSIYPNAFFEIQFIIKKKDLPNGLKEFIKKCQRLKIKTFITGIKIHKKNKNYLSFADDGVSINVNQIFNKNSQKQQIKKFQILYEYVQSKNYKIYISKDFFFKNKTFFKNYLLGKKFIKIKKVTDKKNLFFSDFYKRIKK